MKFTKPSLNVVKTVFQMTCQYAACNVVEHQVLREDTGDISPGRGRDWGKRMAGLGFNKKETWVREGLISRLCVHFFLGFASSGWPISFPRSFKPVHESKTLTKEHKVN